MKLIEAVKYQVKYSNFKWRLVVDNKTVARCDSYEEARLRVALLGWPASAPENRLMSGLTFCTPDDFTPGKVELRSCPYAPYRNITRMAWVVFEDQVRCCALYGLDELYRFLEIFGLRPVSQDFRLPKAGIMTELRK